MAKKEEEKKLSPAAQFWLGLLIVFAAIWALDFSFYGGLSWYQETDERPEEMLAVTAGPKIARFFTEPFIGFLHRGDRQLPPSPSTATTASVFLSDEAFTEPPPRKNPPPPTAQEQWRKRDRAEKAAKVAAEARAASKKLAAKK